LELEHRSYRKRVNPSVTTVGKTAALDDDQQPTDLTEECRIVADPATPRRLPLRPLGSRTLAWEQ
jgi:hypothetical protein